MRRFEVTSYWDVKHEARLLFCQDLHIRETADGDTANGWSDRRRRS